MVNGATDVETGPLLPKSQSEHKAAKAPVDGRLLLGLPVYIVSGTAYCLASASMVLLNKATLSSFNFDAPTCLLFFQCLVCVVLVRGAALFGLVKLEPWNWAVVKVWFPVNLIFVGMICSSFISLKHLGVPMATVLKNLTNLITISGDWVFYGRTYNWAVWGTAVLMLVSAICGGATDLAFDLYGYLWQLANCFFTAGYSLYMRGAMDRVVAVTANKTRLSEFSMVFYNNFLSLPVLAGLILYSGELWHLHSDTGLHNPYFIVAAIVSALLAFGISFASLWFLSSTTPTTYSLIGSLNKVPIAVLGLTMFSAPATVENVLSVVVGLIAGVLFIRAKQASSVK